MYEENKKKFIGYLVDNEKASIRMYGNLFNISKVYEEKFKKDLYSFTPNELMEIYNEMAKKTRFNTVSTYNGLISEYKQWCLSNGCEGVILETCTRIDLKKIKHYKEYTIINDNDMKILTETEQLDGADFNIAIFMRIFWEIDGQESIENILNIRIQDLDSSNNALKIGEKKYKISTYIADLIDEYSQMDRITFAGREGEYKMNSAKDFGGIIIRPTNMSDRIGEPFTTTHLSNMFVKYHQRRIKKASKIVESFEEEIERITVSDLIMSLAIRHMVTYKKTHAEMATSKKYFSNIPSTVYKMIFESNAKQKFPKQYNEYLVYYKNL